MLCIARSELGPPSGLLFHGRQLRALRYHHHIRGACPERHIAQRPGGHQVIREPRLRPCGEQDVEAGVQPAVLEGVVKHNGFHRAHLFHDRADGLHPFGANEHMHVKELALQLQRFVTNAISFIHGFNLQRAEAHAPVTPAECCQRRNTIQAAQHQFNVRCFACTAEG